MAALAAVYAVDVGPERWLRALLDVVTPAFDQGLGGAGYFVDASEPTAPRYWGFVGPERILELWRGWFPQVPVALQIAAHRSVAFGTARGITPDDTTAQPYGMPPPFADILGINGVGADGRGVSLAFVSEHTIAPPAGQLAEDLCAFSTHLARAAAMVLPASVELGPRIVGSVLPAPAPPELAPLGLAALRALATRAMHEDEPLSAAATARAWSDVAKKRLVAIDAFAHGGRRFTIAVAPGSLDTRAATLTEREREAVRLAASGLSNKVIADEMRVGVSTVGTLLSRAAAKLGVDSRVALMKVGAQLSAPRRD